MKSRTQYFTIIVLLITLFAIAILTFFKRSQEQGQLFPATINRDCAPWDGAAFTVKIRMSDGLTLDISIWQSPEIKLPTTFSFSDETQQVGNVSLIPQAGMPEQLTGEVWFQSVGEGMPVEGRFNLTSERGEQFKGNFAAEWDGQIVYCG